MIYFFQSAILITIIGGGFSDGVRAIRSADRESYRTSWKARHLIAAGWLLWTAFMVWWPPLAAVQVLNVTLSWLAACLACSGVRSAHALGRAGRNLALRVQLRPWPLVAAGIVLVLAVGGIIGFASVHDDRTAAITASPESNDESSTSTSTSTTLGPQVTAERCSPCTTVLKGHVTHPRFGPGTFAILGTPAFPDDPEDKRLAEVTFTSDDPAKGVVWRRPYNPEGGYLTCGMSDRLGHFFVGSTNGGSGTWPIVFVPTDSGFDDLGTVNGTPFGGADHALPFADTNNDGIIEIVNINPYVSEDGAYSDTQQQRTTLMWNGESFKTTERAEPVPADSAEHC